MIRDGSGTPLVLFHSLLASERVWRGVIPLLAPHHDTIALTMLGHRGGRPPHTRPATTTHFVDDTLRTLDKLKIERAHLAGNSIGGAVALELARRGRALSVCAFSPAYFHHADGGGLEQAVKAITAVIRDTNRGRPLMPLLARLGAFRRWALRDCAVHGDRLSVAETLDLADDTLGCVDGEDILLATPVPEPLAPMSPLPCAITLVWSAQDRVLPSSIPGTNRVIAGVTTTCYPYCKDTRKEGCWRKRHRRTKSRCHKKPYGSFPESTISKSRWKTIRFDYHR